MIVTALAGLCLSCAAVSVRAGADVAPAAPMLPRLDVATVWTPRADAPDTLVMQARWNLPGNDGRGPLDSVAVNFSNLNASGWLRLNVPVLSVAATLRQPVPMFDATWIVRVQVCAYRRKQVACTDTAAEYVHTEPPLPPMAGLSLSVSKVP